MLQRNVPTSAKYRDIKRERFACAARHLPIYHHATVTQMLMNKHFVEEIDG